MSDIDKASIGKLYGIWIHLSKDVEKIMECFKEEKQQYCTGGFIIYVELQRMTIIALRSGGEKLKDTSVWSSYLFETV